ncbi:MAG: hypothetical protein L6Q63_04220 [Giesbergeria sp.]|nr:hypothetical protein [Giesbergeria sp.]
MTIQSGDIKILASKVMDDVPEGGGGPSGTVIPDNNSNAVFTDVSEVDRAGGAASIRQVHTHVQTADVDRFLGAHIIVSRIPNDDNVAITLAECNPFDRRTDIATAIENYLIQGPEWNGYLFENHVQGQRSIQLFQRLGTPTPPIGRTLVLIKNEGLGTEYKQYVRVTAVESEDRTFSYSSSGGYADYVGTVVTCDISDELREAFPGSTADRAFVRNASETIVRDTTVADAATYYGAVPLSAAADLGDISAKVVGIYSQLVPSARTETTAIDQKPAAQRLLTLASTPRLIEVPIVPHSLRIRVGQENRGFSWVQMLKPLPAPGTVVISFMVLGNWYTVQDDGAGGFTGSGTGVINYTTGSIAVTFPSMPDAGSSVLFQWGENTAFTNRSGAAGYRMPEFSWEVAQAPIKPGTITVTWQSGGATRTATDDGTGDLSGDGTGSVNYATGQISLRPAYMLDAGGEFSTQYTYTPQVTERFASVSPDAGGFATLTLGEVPAPRSISVQWTTVRNCTTSAGSTEAVTQSTTTSGVGPDGKVIYRGGSPGCSLTFYSPTSASTSGFPPSATVEVHVQTTSAGTFDWRIQDVNTTPWPTAAMPADLITGASSGTVVTTYPPGIVAGKAIGTFTVALAAATAMHEGQVVLTDFTTATIAVASLRVEPSSTVRATVTPPTPADAVRLPDGVGAVPKIFPGGVYNSDDLTVVGRKVDVGVQPLYDATYGYSYDPPMGAATWNDAEMVAGQKAMLSQRGVTTTYKRWGF